MRRFRVVLLVVIAVSIVGYLAARHYVLMNAFPWLGRDAGLAAIPYNVVVGPVTRDNGITGLIEIGMSRKEVESRLGKPIVKGLTKQQVVARGFSGDAALDDFYDGIFAWVRYDDSGYVGRIRFDLEAFSQRLGGKQRVLLAISGRAYLLDEGTSLREAKRMLASYPEAYTHGSDTIVVSAKGRRTTSLHFDPTGSHVEEIDIYDKKILQPW